MLNFDKRTVLVVLHVVLFFVVSTENLKTWGPDTKIKGTG